MRFAAFVGIAAVGVALAGCPSSPRFGDLSFGPRPFRLDAPVTVIELKNGMVVVVVPDARTNLVGVDVRYKVGAAEDPAGRAGLAHLVEHLTFELESAGSPSLEAELADAALAYNAHTSRDHTHYWSVGLAGRLDDLLEIEARRMAPGCDQLDEAVFLRERDVVLEEYAERSRHRRDAGHGRAVWGEDHPYGREIASREVADATREEACAFLADHYAPDRAILVVTGKIDPDALVPRLAARFGAIARRSQGTRVAIAQAPLDGGRSEHTASISGHRVVVSFAVPGDAFDAVGELALGYLANQIQSLDRGKRRYRVFDVSHRGGRRAGLVEVTLWVSGEGQVGRAIDKVYEAVEQFAWRRGFRGLEARRSSLRTRLLQRLDAFWGRGQWVADQVEYAPGTKPFVSALAAIDGLEDRDLARWVETHLRRGRSHVAIFRPGEDAPPPPAIGPIAGETEHDLPLDHLAVDLAEAERALAVPARPALAAADYTLDNGLRVILAPVEGSHLVDARLVFPVGGDARDPEARSRAGWAALLLHDDLSPGYTRYDRERLDWIFGLGTLLDAEVGQHSTTFRARGISLFADWHVWRLFWRVHAGIYRDRKKLGADAEEELRELLERLSDPHADAATEALYGPEAVRSLAWLADGQRRVDLERFKGERYLPRGATLIVAGGFDSEEVRGAIASLFGSWPDRTPAAPAEPAELRGPTAPRRVAIEDPEATQVRITVGIGGLPAGDRAARAVLGEMLDARMRRVRDGLGASYGVRSGYDERGELAALWIGGHVDPDRADRPLAAILDAIAALREGGSETTADFVRARRRALARALARTGSAADIAADLEARIAAGEPIADVDGVAAAIAALTPEAIAAVATRDLAAGSTVVVVSGADDAARAVLEAAGVSAADIEDRR